MTHETLAMQLERLSDRLNPILVKETRQALKSRQFTGTFMLLLAASVLVSFGGVALIGPNIDYRAAGWSFFIGYFVVLAFAIFMVVPFGAYRSLASEQEERTYELLSITALRPWQIVIGKLLSSMIQMFIYYSAIAPFMAFTYLLKGIDVLAILFVLVLAMFGSVALCMFGLLLATFSSRRGWLVLLSVVMITGLGVTTIGAVFLAGALVEEAGALMQEAEFWIAMFGLATLYLTSFALVLQLSVSQLTFESDNRSSKIRLALMIQFLVGLAWAAWGWIVGEPGDREVLMVSAALGCFYWAVVGSFLIAEPVGLSRRVARQVPQQGPMRAITALFFPGPGTGLSFVVLHLGCVAAVVGLAELFEPLLLTAPLRIKGTRGDATAMTIAMVSYALFYLGLGALAVRLIRKLRPLPVIGGAAVTAILAAAGILIPNFFVMALRPMQYNVYSYWQLSDPISTIGHLGLKPAILSPLVLLPASMALVAFLANLPAMAREVFAISMAGRRAPVSEGAEVHPEAVSNAVAAAAEPVAGS